MNEIVHHKDAFFEKIVESLVLQDFAVADHFLTTTEVALLTAELLQHYESGSFKDAGIGQGQNYQQEKMIRGDHIRWIERETLSPSAYFFFDRMDDFIQYLNRTCFLGIQRSELHFAVYPTGTFYKRHLDVFQKTKSRKISIICYLNSDWEESNGGHLRLYLSDPNGVEMCKDILPQAGRMVCFKSEALEHEVLPATRERRSITGWLRSE